MKRTLLPLLLLTLLPWTGCSRRPARVPADAGPGAVARPGAPGAEDVVAALRAALDDRDRGVRYAAVMALGKAGVAPATLAQAAQDPAWCVQAEATWWMQQLRVPGRGANKAVDDDYFLPTSPPGPALTQDETQAALAGLRHAERDERMRGATALGRADARVVPPLLTALRDSHWRVRTAAAQSLGKHRRGAQALAPLLRSTTVPLAEAARDALVLIGAAAAAPTAAAMAAGHYGALHWGRTVFEALGADGRGGVAHLTTLLRHDDVNARETAARCLAGVGPGAGAATAALVEALSDPRLCVIANAALALGAIGASHALMSALGHDAARVRAYAAFALGWALGATRGIDQVAFEMRLPVLDVGARSDLPEKNALDAAFATLDGERNPRGEAHAVAVLKRAIWSRDPAIAVRAAGRLEHDWVDARESERVIELLLPTGLRAGTPVDFGNLRWIIGSSEVPACLLYFVRAGLSVERRGYISGNFHRLALPWHIPVMYWFSRTHKESALEGTGQLWFSMHYSGRHARLRAADWVEDATDPGPDGRRIARQMLTGGMEDARRDVWRATRWLLRDVQFEADDVPWLLGALRHFDDIDRDRDRFRHGREVLTRALGRIDDPRVDDWLEAETAARPTDMRIIAIRAARGDGSARRTLVASAERSEYALIRLLAVDAAAGQAALTASIVSDAGAEEDLVDDWTYDATRIGVPLDSAMFVGLEPELARVSLPAASWLDLAEYTPLCNTRRVVERLFLQFEVPGGYPRVDEDCEDAWTPFQLDRALALLHATDATRLLRLLRRAARAPEGESRDHALLSLLKLGDTALRGEILAAAHKRLPETFADPWSDYLRRLPGADTESYVVALINHEDVDPDDRQRALRDLAHLRGLSRLEEGRFGATWDYFDSAFLADELDDAEEDRRIAAALEQLVLDDRMSELRARIESLRPRITANQTHELLWRVEDGDRGARADLWSMLRAGRYGTAHYQRPPVHRLDWDLTVIPHWITDLESNCCRVTDGLESDLFEDGLGLPKLYGTESLGVGAALSARALTWMRLMGGEFVWSPITSAWIRKPE